MLSIFSGKQEIGIYFWIIIHDNIILILDHLTWKLKLETNYYKISDILGVPLVKLKTGNTLLYD
jgi:hypothetical protein